ncbi:MAG: hypothetical protein GY842_14690 [bacterium]|nr:hypothetical protein [bacterium]
MAAIGNHRTAELGFALVCVLGLCVTAAGVDFAGGTGEPNDPYQIVTAEQLLLIGGDPNLLTRYYVLLVDIDLDPTGLGGQVFGQALIAPDLDDAARDFQGAPFAGTFDGQGRTISGLTIESVSAYVGLFGLIGSEGCVRNLVISEARITVTRGSVGGPSRRCGTGILAGENRGLIARCGCEGAVTSDIEVGGLVGENKGDIQECFSVGTVNGTDEEAGGLVGKHAAGRIANSYSTATVGGVYWCSGGLAGSCIGDALVVNCFCTGNVGAMDLLGAVGGGFADLTVDCYYLLPDAAYDGYAGFGIGRTDAQMRKQETFEGWDFYGSTADGWGDTWFMPDGGYPVLSWQAEMTDLFRIPPVSGLAFEQAEGALRKAGFTQVTAYYSHHPTVPEGDVVMCLTGQYGGYSDPVLLWTSLGQYDWTTNPGEGTVEHPYEIWSADQLMCLEGELCERHFVLIDDVDMTPLRYSRAVVAPDQNDLDSGFQGYAFGGTLDGRGHTVRNLIIAGDSGEGYWGLFGRLAPGAAIENLRLESTSIRSEGGCHLLGALAGLNEGNVRDCITEQCRIDTPAGEAIGGLLGGSTGQVLRCSSEGVLTAFAQVGGLIGYNTGDASDCCSKAGASGMSQVGGFIGFNGGDLSYCYATGAVSGSSGGERIGGLVGENQEGRIVQCYAAGSVTVEMGVGQRGGLLGADANGVVEDSYCLDWAVDNGLGIGLTWAAMRQSQSYVGWSGLDDVPADADAAHWFMPYQASPRLAWEPDIANHGYIPAVAGSSRDQTEQTLLQAGFVVGDVRYDFDPCVPSGKAIASVPFHAASLGSAIDIIISQGPYDWSTNAGDGSANNPYQIQTAGQLRSLFVDAELLDDCFILLDDIDLGGETRQAGFIAPDLYDPTMHSVRDGGHWAPSFSGCFNGNGFAISNLFLDGVGSACGFFGAVALQGRVENLCLRNMVIQGERLANVGPLVGYNAGDISSCRADSCVGGLHNIGGLVGRNSGRIAGSCSSGLVSAGGIAGGLVGVNYGLVYSCYSDARVDGESVVGGLVGENYSGCIALSYSKGRPLGRTHVGGLVGRSYAVAYLSYWDTDTSGRSRSAVGQGRSTREMQLLSTYPGWGSEGQWTLDEGRDYPRLAWQALPGEPILEAPSVYGGGSGSSEEPYLIWTKEQFRDIGWRHWDWDKSFVLMTDIDLGEFEPEEILPIGTVRLPFTGAFDGRGHAISGFTHYRSDNYLGLFGFLDSDDSTSLGRVHDVHVRACNVMGADYVGGLVGCNQGEVTRCSVDGLVASWGGYFCGGLVGRNGGDIRECRSVARVDGWYYVGGLVGTNAASVVSSYSVNPFVHAGAGSPGGLVGDNYGTILNCWSTGSAAGEHVRGGGLVGWAGDGGDVVSSFWDTDVSGLSESNGGIGLTTTEMQTAATFLDARWDFDTIWMICEGRDYPHLQWEEVDCE